MAALITINDHAMAVDGPDEQRRYRQVHQVTKPHHPHQHKCTDGQAIGLCHAPLDLLVPAALALDAVRF